MFKTMAILGALAGGAAFAIYHHTGGFGCHDGDCPLSSGSCCAGSSSGGSVPSCCQGETLSDDVSSPCCAAGEAVLIGTVGPKIGSCCSAKACCELGGECCSAGESAKEAVAGPAAMFVKAVK